MASSEPVPRAQDDGLEARLARLQEENAELRREIRVAHDAAQISARLVIDQFAKTESVLDQLRDTSGQLKAVLDAASQISIVACDPDGTIRLFSAGAERLLGYAAEEMVGRRSVLSLHQEGELQEAAREVGGEEAPGGNFMGVFEGYVAQGLSGTREWTYVRRDGTTFPVNLSITGLPDSDGGIAGYLSVAMDITPRKQAEARLHQANQELEAANQRLVELDQLKSGFLSSVSHELRTPLTSIRGFAQLISRDFERSFLPLVEGDRKLGKKGERVRENLEVIQSESERLARLVNDVLDLAKIESGRMEWQDERLDPAEVVQQALQAGQGAFEDKPAVVLESEVAEGLPTVVADRDRVVEVLVNLVNNAAKFTEQGRVEVAAFPDADGWLRIEVRDTGSGFPPEQAEQLFDKFQQARQGDTLEDKPKGTGLGLAISREIVEHYGGRIWAESQPGVGSTFTLVLPPAMAESGPARERPAAPAVSPGSSGREPAERETGRPEELAAGSAPLILVVDDSTPVCNYLEQLLQDQGYRTLTAGDGRAALHEAHRHRPDLITMDLAMPGMDGRAVIAELRRDPELASIPIIVVSALADRGNTGADFTLGKPVDEGLLLESLRLLLEARSSSGGQSEMPCLVLHSSREAPPAELRGVRLVAAEYCPVDSLATRLAEGFQGMVVVPTDLLQEVDRKVLEDTAISQLVILPKDA